MGRRGAPGGMHSRRLRSLRHPGDARTEPRFVLNEGWAEIKRMWVVHEARGRGLSKAVSNRLVAEAEDHGAQVLRLETGIASHEALGLYRSAGFTERGPFAGYEPDRLSVFMEKRLRGPA